MMSHIDDDNDKSAMFSDLSILHSKMRETFFELAIKRKLLEESRDALGRLDSEKHLLVQKLERGERELSDVNIHLEVAIKSAREAEAERSTARELLARQGAQLEAASKDREHLQQANRTLQLEVDEMRRELDDVKSKSLTQTHFLNLIKKKNAQNKTAMDTLSLEINKLEKYQADLKQLCAKITQITKVVNTLLKQQKHDISKLKDEKLELQGKIVSLSAQKEEPDKEKLMNHSLLQDKSFLEWEEYQKDMQKRLEVCGEENQELQTSLDSAILTITRLQGIENQLHRKIRELEEMLEAKNQCGLFSEDKETQTQEDTEDQTQQVNGEERPILQATTTLDSK